MRPSFCSRVIPKSFKSFPCPSKDCLNKAEVLVITGALCRGSWREVYEGKAELPLISSSPAGWDQSDKFIKIYISLNGVQKLPAEDVQVNFTER